MLFSIDKIETLLILIRYRRKYVFGTWKYHVAQGRILFIKYYDISPSRNIAKNLAKNIYLLKKKEKFRRRIKYRK